MASQLRTDLNAFLYSAIADDADGMPLTLLSALARSGVDPWAEAADLARLPTASATQKLTEFLGRVPNGPTPGAQTESVVSRLVALLHTAPAAVRAGPAPAPAPARASAPTPVPTPPADSVTPRKVSRAIYYLLAVIVLLAGNWALQHRQSLAPADSNMPAP